MIDQNDEGLVTGVDKKGIITDSVMMIAACIIIVVFLRLGLYALPQADDFSYAITAKSMQFFEAQRHWYNQWTGRYFATGMATLLYQNMNLIEHYWLVPLISVLVIFGCWLTALASCGLPGVRLSRLIVASLVITAVILVTSPIQSEAYYWLIGSATYTIPCCLFLLFLIPFAHLFVTRQPWKRCMLLGILTVLISAVIGSNETLMVGMDALIAATLIGLILTKKPQYLPYVCYLLLICVVCSLIVYVAPGNKVRMSSLRMRLTFLQMVMGSGLEFLKSIISWTINPATICSSIVLAPLILALGKKIDHWQQHDALLKRRLQQFPFAWGAIVYAMFIPSWFSMQTMVALRTKTAIYVIFLIGWFVWLAIIASNEKARTALSAVTKASVRMGAAVVLLLFLSTSDNFLNAMDDNGVRGKSYREELLYRFSLLQSVRQLGGTGSAVPRLNSIPPTLYSGDIQSDPNTWPNPDYARFFGLSRVWVVDM